MSKSCEQCGAPLKPDLKFCEQCGAPIADKPPASPQNPFTVAATPPSVPEPAKESPSFPTPIIVGTVIGIGIIFTIAVVLFSGFMSPQPDLRGEIQTGVVIPTNSSIGEESEYWCKIGEEERFKGNLAQAEEAYDRALALTPNNADAWKGKGYLEENREDYRAAITAFRKSVELAPSQNSWLLFHIGTDHNQLGQFEEALKAWDEILSLNYIEQSNVNMIEFWNQRGISLLSLGRYEEAIESFDMTISLYPKHTYAWNNKGKALEALGRNSEAALAYKKVLETDPTYKEAQINLDRLKAKGIQ